MIVRVAVQPPSLDDLGNWNHLDALGISLDHVFWTRCGLYLLTGVESVRAHERLTANRVRLLHMRMGGKSAARVVGCRVRMLIVDGRLCTNGALCFIHVYEGHGTGAAHALGTVHCVYVGWINTLPVIAAGNAQLAMERLQSLLLIEKGGGLGRSSCGMYPWRVRGLVLPVVRAHGLGRLLGEKKGHNWCKKPAAVGLWQRRA